MVLQITSFIKVDFSKRDENKELHVEEVLELLKATGNLEQNGSKPGCAPDHASQHAADSIQLFEHLLQLKDGTSKLHSQDSAQTAQEISLSEPLFIISSKDTEAELLEQNKTRIVLKDTYIELTLRSKGKAELYFHSYFWLNYLRGSGATEEQQTSKPVIKRMECLAGKLKQVLETLDKFPFGEKEYDSYVEEFGLQKSTKKIRLIEQLQRCLFVAQISDNHEALRWIEKLLIQLLGYFEVTIRDYAIVLLNMLYDEIDWQLQSAFRPVVRCIGQHFKVHLSVRLVEAESINNLYLGLSAPSPLESAHGTVLTWHKISKQEVLCNSTEKTEISINFGKFWKCGFYDWRLVNMSADGKLQPLVLLAPPTLSTFPLQRTPASGGAVDYDDDPYDMDTLTAQGRFIVHARGMRDHNFHEVQIDYQNAELDFRNQTFKRRGTFNDVQNAIPRYRKSGISALYLMGVFERDNCPIRGSATTAFRGEYNKKQYRKEDASALAITSREEPCKMLGGASAFNGLMQEAKRSDVKIVVDCVARISSSRHHRKYRDLLLSYLDEEGRRRICYGTDGHAKQFEDTAMLNYRKLEAWDLLIEEVLSFSEQSQVDGIHLDNGQAWPQILEVDVEELQRVDVDGQPAYSAQQLLDGEIVLRNENHGFWYSNNMETYANPFFVKLARRIWATRPNFMLLGECWGGFMFEHRQIILARSGVIPRLYSLPQSICKVFGKKLHRDGRVTSTERSSITTLREWYQENRLCLPEGSIMLQSSTAHNWPYPAALYGKGTWAAVDILYFLPDIPITFMGELDGEVYRIGQGSVFQHDQQEVKTQEPLKRTNSQVRLALTTQKDHLSDSDEGSTQVITEGVKSIGLTRVRSGSNLAAIVADTRNVDVESKEQKYRSEVGSDIGYDLSKIRSHYESRMQLRASKMVLRYGELCPLAARTDENLMGRNQPFMQDVLTFARYSLMETAVIATNLSDQQRSFFIDLSQLYQIFKKSISDNAVIVTEMVIQPMTWEGEKSGKDYFFLREFMSTCHWQTLAPYSTSLSTITICQNDKLVFQQAMGRSIERSRSKLMSGKNIDADQISLIINDCLVSDKKSSDPLYFANLVGGLQHNLLDQINVSFPQFMEGNKKIKQDPVLMGRLMALCEKVGSSNIIPSSACRVIKDSQKLGPIVFCTPELGRWSTVGGLGVMVDELSIGLRKLGQEVIVISPYYDRNRKGQTGYLDLDPAGIKYVDNISVELDQKYILGVYEGVVSGVKVVFLHHAQIFPVPYADSTPSEVMRQLAVFGKACLEYCCVRQTIPSVCVSNDWFTGLVPAYAKIGAFGPTFKGSTFLHICHNLMEDYEGRIYPGHGEGFLEHIHKLPRNYLVAPNWSKFMVNPSRCAIMNSDQWTTVSLSYRDDLLNSSSLAPLLKEKLQPFAFPNGIPIADRIKKLDAAAPNHLEAKKIIQRKYFQFQDLDDSIPLFAFVGRITTQKGVHLILDVAEDIIKKYDHKVQFLVGGPANMRDPYSATCAHRMWDLNQRYNTSFWSAPSDFFTDGACVNRGADFGLMPSLFEPGGIVQHEFFVGCTPVVAFKTGGLKDSVIEFQWESEIGSGYTFESYTKADLIFAIDRAIGTFKNKQKYAKLRQNAFEATMPGETVSKAWLQEFNRLRGKTYYDSDAQEKAKANMGHLNPEKYSPMNLLSSMFGEDVAETLQLNQDDIDLGAGGNEPSSSETFKLSDFDKKKHNSVTHQFMLHNRGPRHQKVEICGSFDGWKQRRKMLFDHVTSQWFISLFIPKGEHFYKYVIDDVTWTVNMEESQRNDRAGNLNNFIKL